ncbi:MAG TPA: GNAT family N-acetyltransferase [Bryobacteraceae bacterium]|nr:GNAT family N-acetyltransferase [Bryobacteraceae bacterium]
MITKSNTAIIRHAIKADLEAITAIYAHHVLTGCATFELEPPDLATMTQRFEALTSSAKPYLVATVEDRVVGYAYAGPYRSRPAYSYTVEDSIYLHPDEAGKGIGTLLLRSLIGECTVRGYRQIIAVIGDPQNGRSVMLHERCGFQHVGILKGVGHKHGRWLDTALMQLPLQHQERQPN